MGSRRRSLIILVVVLVLLGLSAWAIESKPTRLGLDLQGGTELIYQALGTPGNKDVDPADVDQALDIMRERVNVFGVTEAEVSRVGRDQISVALPDVQNAEEAQEQVGKTAQLFFYDFEKNVVPQDPKLSDALHRPYNRLYDAVIGGSEREPSCATDADGELICTTNGTYYLFDADTLAPIGLPAERRQDLFLQFPDDKQPAGTVVKVVPRGTVVVQEEAAADDPTTDDVNESETSPRGWYVLEDRPGLSGDEIRNPEQNLDPVTNQPNVTFDFTDKGREAFQDVTLEIAERGAAKPEAFNVLTAADAAGISDSFAVVLDGEIRSRPIINFFENPAGIDGRTGAQISGNFTITEAQDLAKTLRIGALPIKLQLISQSTVSATLGQQALDNAILAGLAGLALVLLFLLAYYRFLGLVAALGLFVYAVFYLAMIKMLGITMTLPGIAGLILTIGVAADSNIVIFERIKEEARLGRSMLSAITQGYRKGIATIIDANVITLITAFVLFVLAKGGVKGFAFTLGIGTIVSLFTAVLFTQAVLAVLGRARFLRSPRFLGASEQRVGWNFDFTGLSKYFFSFSGLILVVGAIAFSTQQLNLGIDFESGTRIKASLDQPVPETDEERTGLQEDVRTALQDAGIDGMDAAEIQTASEEGFGDTVIQIQAKILPEEAPRVQTVLTDQFGLVGGEDGFQNTSIGPTFGEQIARSALIALIFSLLVISAYIAIRFEAKYAVPVLIALVHDILITGGIYALTSQEVTSATVAAFLTILGYSMYDTVIVFDRIRENVPRMPRAAFSQIVNRSMSEVLTRSLITGLSTVFLVTMILVFGDETLRGFAFAMMVGIASGTYSSIFIASPVLTEWKEREPAYRARRANIAETMGYVPTFPEDNVVSRVEGHGEELLVSGAPPEQKEVPADAPDAAVPTGAPDTVPLPPQPAASQPVTGDDDETTSAKRAAKAERQRRRQRSRRKHGRNR